MNGTGGINTGGTRTEIETGTVRAGQRGRHAGENGEQARQARAGGQGKTGDRWWGMCHSNGSSTGGKVPIRFGTYNIRN